MKFLKQISLFALFSILVLASCQKEEVFTSQVIDDTVKPTQTYVNGVLFRSVSNNEGLDLECLSVGYPFQVVLSDSTIVDINSQEDFEGVNTITEEEENPVYLIDFVYPLNVIHSDGTEATINNANELGLIFANCIPTSGWDNNYPTWFFPAWVIDYEGGCYQLVYPVALLDENGTSSTASNEQELVGLLSDGTIYSFAFPLNLEDEDANLVVAADGEELTDLLVLCSPTAEGGVGMGTVGCYTVSYPIGLLLGDGSTVTINSENEFINVIIGGNWAGFELPITLVDSEGNEVVVNNDVEISDAILSCIMISDNVCSDFVYPIQVVDLESGNTLTFNDLVEFDIYQSSNNYDNTSYEFIFPLTLTYSGSNEQVTVNNMEELLDAVEECW